MFEIHAAIKGGLMRDPIKIEQALSFISIRLIQNNLIVATLALGSWPRQRGCKGVGQEEA